MKTAVSEGSRPLDILSHISSRGSRMAVTTGAKADSLFSSGTSELLKEVAISTKLLVASVT
eukprot:CAMPEP_0184668030 /NCGR_PEP_ID=MMETSP0308-20130426/70392_1 /TAXON_ID=38269 /ORGANISM="Gloeochaete witrockiana, Strain SAG 46.84" /LENGTH=60 /DNA_ID=CAMNT_0027113543 /DNA_START=650 /DNA_END=832 /DNA_ORIENTATION=+